MYVAALVVTVEAVGLVEKGAGGVYLKEGGAAFLAQRSAEVGYAVVEVEMAFLAKHSHGCKQEFLRRDVLLLINGYDTVGEVEPPLELLVVADGKHGIGATEGGEVARRLPGGAVGDDAFDVHGVG